MRQKCFLLLLIALTFACKKVESNTLTSPPPPVPQDVLQARVGSIAPRAETPALPRMIIRTAQLSVVVSDTSATIEKLTHAVEAAGGYVNDSRIWRDGEQLRATLSIRVPADRLTQTLATLRHLAVRVQSENISGQDVSQESVDLQSELRNQEAAENEMRLLLGTVRERAKKAEDILAVYEQLKQIRGEIEKTKGRIQYLGQMSAMATINVELIPDAIARPVVEPGWQPVAIAKDAARALTNALKALATVGIWVVIYVLPIAALFTLVAYALVRLVRGERASSPAVVEPPARRP